LEKDGAEREVVAAEVDDLGDAGKWESAGEALGRLLRDVAEILFYTRGVCRALVDLDDVTVGIDEERGGDRHIAVAVEDVAIGCVVNGDDVVAALEDWERKVLAAQEGAKTFFGVDIHRDRT